MRCPRVRVDFQKRVLAGLKRARAAGEQRGRPQVGAGVKAEVRALRSQGKGRIAISKTVGCGVGTVQRIVAQGAR
jgi:hypothetical protein